MKERCDDAKGLSALLKESDAVADDVNADHIKKAWFQGFANGINTGADALIDELESFIYKHQARYLRLPNLSEVLDHMKRWAEL